MKWSLNPCRRYEMEISLLALEPDSSRSAVRDRTAMAVQVHLEKCPGCRARFEELRALSRNLERLGALPEEASPEGFRTRWVSTVCNQAEAAPAGTHLVAWLEGLLFSPRAAWAGLAGIWLLVSVFNLATPGAARPGIVARASLQEIVQTIKTELLANSATDHQAARPHARWPEESSRIAPPRSERKIETITV